MALAYAGSPALPDSDRPSGPVQRGATKNGQYVYWITYPFPTDAQLSSIRPPNSFSREEFSELVVKVHSECGIDLLETAVFWEMHEHGKPHLNCLVRAGAQYRWLAVAQRLFDDEAIRVNFAPKIKTWSQGIIYGCVASEHKPPGMIDAHPHQWAKCGSPTRFEDVIPPKWQQPGFTRKTQMTHLAFLELCREHSITDETSAWSVAADLEAAGDKGLMAFLFANDVGAAVSKARQAIEAHGNSQRSRMTRIDILKQFATESSCKCKPVFA